MTPAEASALWARAERGEFNGLPPEHKPLTFVPLALEGAGLGVQNYRYDAARAYDDWRWRQDLPDWHPLKPPSMR